MSRRCSEHRSYTCAMRTRLVHSDIVVFTSVAWKTTCTAIRSGDQTLLVDSLIFPEELSAVPDLLRQHGFETEGIRLFTTHADWDHIMGPLMFPEAPLWCGESSAERLAGDPNELARDLLGFDEMFYVERPGLPSLDRLEPVSVPGEVGFGEERIELLQADGHTADGTAAWLPGVKLLLAGDYVSPVELPRLRGSLEANLETLDRLEGPASAAELVIPGHGYPISREVALRVLTEDRAYLHQLKEVGEDAALPAGRDDAEQQRIHRDMNVPTAEGRPIKGLAGGNLPG
jgi:glyoxylase-like metal-dependent hydrolase (beta-lactamase superfamily II)